MSDTLFETRVWVVEEWCDSVKARPKKAVDKDNAFRLAHSSFYHGGKPLQHFDSEREAWLFVVDRAQRNVVKQELALKNAKARLRKVEKRLSAIA